MRQYLGPCGSNLDTVWVQPGHGVGLTWTRCGSKLGHGVGPNLDTVWVKDGPSWIQDGPSWTQDGPSWTQDGSILGQDGPSLIQDGSILDPGWVHPGPSLGPGDPEAPPDPDPPSDELSGPNQGPLPSRPGKKYVAQGTLAAMLKCRGPRGASTKTFVLRDFHRWANRMKHLRI